EPFVGRETVLGTSRNDSRLQTVSEGITTGHERGARRRTHRLHIELFEFRPAGGEFVEVRGLDVGAAKTDILPAEVVCNDVNDIRPARRNLSVFRFAPLRICREGNRKKAHYARESGERPEQNFVLHPPVVNHWRDSTASVLFICGVAKIST